MTTAANPWTRAWFEDIAREVAPGCRVIITEGHTIVHVTLYVTAQSWWKRKRIERVYRDRVLDADAQPLGIGCRIDVLRMDERGRRR